MHWAVIVRPWAVQQQLLKRACQPIATYSTIQAVLAISLDQFSCYRCGFSHQLRVCALYLSLLPVLSLLACW